MANALACVAMSWCASRSVMVYNRTQYTKVLVCHGIPWRATAHRRHVTSKNTCIRQARPSQAKPWHTPRDIPGILLYVYVEPCRMPQRI